MKNYRRLRLVSEKIVEAAEQLETPIDATDFLSEIDETITFMSSEENLRMGGRKFVSSAKDEVQRLRQSVEEKRQAFRKGYKALNQNG